MSRRSLTATGLLLATTLLQGCCWCHHKQFWCCGHNYFAPYDPCTVCYQPNGAAPVYAAPAGYPAIPTGMPLLKSAPNSSPGTTNPGTAPTDRIPSFPAAATLTNGGYR